jgi:hypothetical protein
MFGSAEGSKILSRMLTGGVAPMVTIITGNILIKTIPAYNTNKNNQRMMKVGFIITINNIVIYHTEI